MAANRSFTVALVLLLVATRTSPSYCADMLGASTAAARAPIAAEAPVSEAHHHHHHQVSDESAAGSQAQLTARPASCRDCGDLAATALTSQHSSSKLVASARGEIPRVYPLRQTPADLLLQDTSPDLPFLAPLRI